MITHHPSDEHLLHYAAGALPQGFALVVAVHLNYCPACRATVQGAESLGGALLEGEEAIPLAAGMPALDDRPEPRVAPSLPAGTDVPAPLRPYIGNRLSDIRWRSFWFGMQTVRIPCPADAAEIRLLRISPGRAMPVHTHAGDEMTMVLQGSYSDETGRYDIGDVAIADPALTHTPVANDGPLCVCLTVFDAPLKFTSRLARLASRVLLR